MGGMDNIDGVGGIGGNGGIGGLKPTLQPALCPRCTSYARLAFLISSILRNTLRPLKKFQTVFFIKCEKYNVIPAQAGNLVCRCGNLSDKTVSLDFTP
ncbi:hypothetical protein BWZ28_10040 [Neisseria meningitidis]|nr:hypothetical protein BWZ28_10040 [Neisseria meningitidis]